MAKSMNRCDEYIRDFSVESSLAKRKLGQTFQSDLPKHVSVDGLPDSVCYRDIELFYLKDPDSKRDVLCAIIKFCNLKGRLEDADR
ncbi:hypothetical protein EYZ11_004445 [Aspergillus tanneri]|uniref:Uncharacterized protein n=1 Tax=Aspergillus tanneri TaxID=1220188 RepID=A0A4S3JKU2_9EURO|nr:hypothetical protein EYZ11_004445 [Aspergillus tanneri]